MKKLLLTFFVALLSVASSWADNALIVTFNDGSQQTFALADLPDIMMENDKMTIKAGATTAEYDLYTVKTFTFGNASGIKAVKEARLTVNGDCIVVSSPKARVSVYAIDGAQVNATVSRGTTTTTVDLSSLPKGHIYVVKIDGKSVKILK